MRAGAGGEVLAARDLSFTRGERALLDGASFVVDDGERVALLGRNGAGKSTLLAILAGALVPDGGVVERGRGQRVGASRKAADKPPPDSADARIRTKRKRSYREERELANMEGTLMEKEARRDEVRALLESPDAYRDADRARSLTAELAALDAEIEALYARWQELSDLAPM
jgi:ATPase subunit of ABC transporter with duplicated ATPase domains